MYGFIQVLLLLLHIISLFGWSSMDKNISLLTETKPTGHSQSPINIATKCAVARQFPDLEVEFFDDNVDVKMVNDGFKVAFSVANKCLKRPSLKGGPLKGLYRFKELHFHWGNNDVNGSEHQINNIRYAMELHFVYYNTKYSNFSEASNNADGIAAVAFFAEANEKKKSEFTNIAYYLRKIIRPDEFKMLKAADSLNLIKRQDWMSSYYTYNGSVTHKQYQESVTWIIFPKPRAISSAQVAEFRKLYRSKSPCIMNIANNRRIQPLNGRKIEFAVK